MAYEVTAAKFRPQSFEQLVGQEFVSETLKNSMQNKRIARAYLLSGPRGVGKTSTARIIAKALNCVNGPTATPCNACV
ncbi:MAG TPA: AAA family ATPase, partial [Spirochaetota bacterium]|nr:AAA family ATPase [Spirochaetota bacterium]